MAQIEFEDPVQFNNVSTIMGGKAADCRIFQEFASQCEPTSRQKSG